MAQKPPAPRGRPREYDPDTALSIATSVFRANGLAATTMDQLGEAMGMNRPSIQAAFGDKTTLFMKSLQRYEKEGETALRAVFGSDLPLRSALREVFAMMIERFRTTEGEPGGCLLFSAAAGDASASVRSVVLDATCSLDGAFAAKFRDAQAKGEIAASPPPEDLAILASGLVHSLSVRARAGASKQTLEAVVDTFLQVLCGKSD